MTQNTSLLVPWLRTNPRDPLTEVVNPRIDGWQAHCITSKHCSKAPNMTSSDDRPESSLGLKIRRLHKQFTSIYFLDSDRLVPIPNYHRQ